jgi:NADPH:quinone reductase-like Zn-dependent oxidoreductase
MNSRIPETMTAVLLTGHGGLDKLAYRTDVPVPKPAPGEVLIRVRAAGINNTDINTRIGWYSKSVTGATGSGGAGEFQVADDADGSWSGEPLKFPRIQGADCCGHIVAVGEGVPASRIGERVLVTTIQGAASGAAEYESVTYGSECDGAFAQYAIARSSETFKVTCDWSDAELASIPCAYSTAEGMLQRAEIGKGERVLITGASGGVGSAAVQLARRRGADVIAVAGAAKADAVRALGADRVVPRGADLIAALGRDGLDAVVDLVGGPEWPHLLEVLRRGGRYVTAGAIAGPIVELDLRTLYLKDLRLLGCTWQDRAVFAALVSYIERGEIRPLVARTYPLSEIRRAQEDFLAKGFVGKLVLIPPQD